MKTTLKALRKAGVCFDGYNKLVSSLSGKPYKEQASYMRFKHEAEIPLEYICNSNGLDDALWCLRVTPDSERDARLFAVWCARQVQHLMTDHRSFNALDVAERFANGLATVEELATARKAAKAAVGDAARSAVWAAARAAENAARAAAWDAARSAVWAASRYVAWEAAWAAAEANQTDMFLRMCRGEAPWQKEIK